MTKTCFQIYKRSSPILRRSGSLRTVPKFPGEIRIVDTNMPKDQNDINTIEDINVFYGL